MSKPIFVIDGADFTTLEEFYNIISRVFSFPSWWGRNLDAFDEMLQSEFMPSQGYIIFWKNAILSQERLGYDETIRQLLHRLENCHPSNRDHILREIEMAKTSNGSTVFDWIVELIQDHCKGGSNIENRGELVFS